MRLHREERGGILALSAVMIPVFILLAALVVDVGTWFTHKRQLQNRADSAALAAGVEYATRWAACVQNGDPLTKSLAATAIEDAARQYAGDPGVAGTLRNTEITEQGRVNVEVNSTSNVADPNTSWNDIGINGTGPCDPQPTGDGFSSAGNYWLDVKVRERDQPTLFGLFGLDLIRNTAQARVELKTADAGSQFIPIAVPEQDIRQAQIRYYNHCDPNAPVQLAKATLRPVDGAYQTASGTTLWAPTVGDAVGGTPTGISITWPASTSTCGPYAPIGAEVRIAGVDSNVVDIDALSCQQLQAARFADCWTRVSNIRVFNDNPTTEPWFKEVILDGGTCAPDAYFARTTSGSCTYGVSVAIDWNSLATGRQGSNFTVNVGGHQLSPPNGPNGNPNGVWTGGAGLATNSALGRSNATLTWSCRNNPGPGPNSCGNGSVPIHSLYLGDEATAGIVDLVRTSGTGQSSGSQPGAPLHWVRAMNNPVDATIYPTVGLNSSLYIGQKRVLRVSGPQSNQSVDCEPATGGQGHDFQMFLNGCQPWYGINDFSGPPWWFPASQTCPDKNGILAQPNSENSPWECVIKAPGFSPPVVAGGISAAIGNCSNINNNSCQQHTCTNPNYYNPLNPGQWALQGGTPSQRVVKLFIVPYGAYKNTGPQDGLPILNFAAFYVTGWQGQPADANPCTADPPGPAIPDEIPAVGEIVGYFVNWTEPGGPYDPNSTCVIGQLTPCTAVLVR